MIIAAIAAFFAILLFVALLLAARLAIAIDDEYPEISAELGPWNETPLTISGSARLAAFTWSRRAATLPGIRRLILAMRVVSLIYAIAFVGILVAFFWPILSGVRVG